MTDEQWAKARVDELMAGDIDFVEYSVRKVMLMEGCAKVRAELEPEIERQKKLYESAVRGRQDFRAAFNEERARARKMTEALEKMKTGYVAGVDGLEYAVMCNELACQALEKSPSQLVSKE